MSKDKQDIKKLLNSWLTALTKHEGTDLHIKSDALIRARIKGAIVPINKNPINASTIKEIAKLIMGKKYPSFEEEEFEFDGTYMLNEAHRFRVNIFMHFRGLALNFRLIPQEIKTIEQLNLPKALHKLAKLERGLVLITGTTGSGKSTLLASVIEEVNNTAQKHIITIEDPIEYIYNDKKSIIEQREIGLHTHTFSTALRSSMREDPDIIVVGEIRDIDTAESILQAVNTGHLVFSTVHTLDAKETIDRMISIFPSEEQNRVRATLASSLEAVVSQRLVKGLQNNMLPAVEVMFKSPFIQELIKNKRDDEITDVLDKEHNNYGSTTFKQSLFELVVSGKISEETAYFYASSPADLKLMLSLSEEYTNHK